jgi:21S rRNA (GM2251-2'-O)-methyltransferase
MTIKYTTAASQFLYGRSVVKAALEQGRRKLYNLYIYGGENRRDNKDNTFLSRLAEKQGVPITIVPTEEQRLMDKMSMGRPHNGFVLEASPLPQLPIRSLGKLEETPTRLGFHVELDFQTKEEEAINGTESFFRRANDVMPKPLVLLLNEIMDPGNLGGIIRTASYLGIDAVGITSRGSSTLTPVALKSAAGAVEEISLFTVDDPLRFIEDSSKAGWKTFAAVAPPDRKLVRKHGDKFISTDVIEANSPLNEHPCLLVLGNEGHGLPKPLKVAADYELSVPRFVQGSCIDSLNVSVAAGLLCHSFVKEPLVEAKPAQVEAPVVTPEPQVLVEAEEKPVEAENQGVLLSSEGGEEYKAEEAELEKADKPKEETTEEKKSEEEKPEEKKPEEKKPEETKAENVEMMF